jgi:cysteinyl-tRNA synthetase
LTSDLISRVLDYAGYKVEKVMNITDVGHLTNDDEVDSTGEDKISKMARKEKVDPFEISRKFEQYFFEDEKELRIIPAKKYPRATEYITGQINLAKKLIDEGFAYEANSSVYFRTEKFKKYGQLSGNNLENLISGARVEINSEKESPLDFALWKKADENHLMQWKSPWGQGFPGWHAECSVMSRELLGFPFDIHTGGEDNVFPHHECEIAQNECSNHGKKSVNYWLHTKHLQVEGKKMSKSAGNFYTIRDLFEKGWAGNEIRFALMSAHYRSTLNFSIKSLEQARASIARIVEVNRVCLATKHEPANNFAGIYREKYQSALFDDLNIADALATAFEMINKIFKLESERKLDGATVSSALDFLQHDFDPIFDCLPVEVKVNELQKSAIEKLVQDRMKARENKDWAESDRIRDLLAEKYNVELLDSAVETTWRVK